MSHHDWNDIFSMTMPALELVLRGSVMYWFLFLVFRLKSCGATSARWASPTSCSWCCWAMPPRTA